MASKGGRKITVPQVTGLQIQTSVNALPIPIVYGSPRVPMNLIYSNGFRAVAQKASGGKGIASGGKGGQTTGYKYYATFLGALCEGIISQILVIFDDQQNYTPTTMPPGKVFFQFVGSPTQTPWSYIVSRWPGDALAYKDTAYLGFQDYPLDSSGTIPQLNFVPSGWLAATSPLNLTVLPITLVQVLGDADPAEVIIDFLTNEVYGAGFPFNSIAINETLRTSAAGYNPAIGDSKVSTFCQAVGLAWSVVLNNSEPASSILDRWCKNIGVAPVWNGSQLKFIPYWDFQASGNPGYAGAPYTAIPLKYYQPDTTVVASFGEQDFLSLGQGEDPVTIERVDPADVKNVVRIDFRDRFNMFNDVPVELMDENQVELYGRRVDKMATADEFTLAAYANVSAQIQLQRNISVRNTVTFKLDPRWAILDPMDGIELKLPSMGLPSYICRIRSIEEDDKGALTIIAEEWPIGSAASIQFEAQQNAPATFAVTNATPPAVNTPIIFEPTAEMMAAQGISSPVIMVGISGGPGGVFSPDWGGCIVNVSTDGVTYVELGQQVGPSRHGVTTASLGAYAGINPDNGHTLSVDLSESQGTLESVSTFDAMSGLSLCCVSHGDDGDFELLGYTTATLTGPNQYDLTGLYRGLYGTVGNCSKPSGSQFCRVDQNVFAEALQTAMVGVPLFVKFQSFNTYALEVQDISTCTVYNYTPTGAGLGVIDNPLYLQLVNHLPADLQNFVSVPLDLNAGGSSDCAPGYAPIDLNL